MDATEIKQVLRDHADWLMDNKKGKSANLRGADLRFADLQIADLRCADLRFANLQSANLRGADLRFADLRFADLRFADLRFANLQSANLQSAENIPEITAAQLSIVPEVGAFVGWKKLAGNKIAKLLIPEDANRSNGTERKCRAEFVDVIEGEGISMHDGKTRYAPGLRVHCGVWNPDRWVTCGGGIHFYITRAEAVEHS